ncbi:MAG: hypothetical protein BWY91_00907 [bacterium ADurb.BinA028]|nr:MAG: hypothetical protein BWY91_00907 [bacterium ADurb.BinA028]
MQTAKSQGAEKVPLTLCGAAPQLSPVMFQGMSQGEPLQLGTVTSTQKSKFVPATPPFQAPQLDGIVALVCQ